MKYHVKADDDKVKINIYIANKGDKMNLNIQLNV